MAKTVFQDPIKSVHGRICKGGVTIMRKKTFRAPNGSVLKEGKQESYRIVNPRDFTNKPPKNEELTNMSKFGEISRLTTEIIRSDKYTDAELSAMTAEQRAHVAELREQLDSFRQRFNEQFKRPDPEAPFEKTPRPGSAKLQRKQYVKLDNFIQAIIRANYQQN